MSSLTALILLAAMQADDAAPAPAAPLLPPVRLSAEDALANERSLIAGKPARCDPAPDGEIVVCGRKTGPPPRLPMPDQRAEPGEVVRHPSEPPSAGDGVGGSCARPGSCEPSKLGQTLGKIFNWLGGNDPDPNVP